MKLGSKILTVLGLLCCYCVTPYETPAIISEPVLVVNGLITDQPGPYKVTVAYTSINSKITSQVYPSGTNVFIIDDLGNQQQLTEVKSGQFESPYYFRGVAGRSYFVRVILLNGSVYESSPELLKQGQAIDNVIAQYESLPKESKTRGQFKTYVETQDPITKGDFYRWTWKHYGVQTYCSVYKLDGDPNLYSTLCCDSCWNISQCETCITLATDQVSNGKKISQHLLDIPYDSKEPYFLSIQQFTLSKSAYQFWKTLDEQINVVGGVFDPPPAAVKGNVRNIDNADEQVLGYFGASSVTTKNLFIDRSQVSEAPYGGKIDFVITGCTPCKENYFFTAKKPEGWD